MANLIKGIKTWFFELIEDAVGKETMKKYRKEMDALDHDSKGSN
tara:strand:- start:8342 stop:8473 length:132 start_codon:yes stop_codon:yes gene_type:complete